MSSDLTSELAEIPEIEFTYIKDQSAFDRWAKSIQIAGEMAVDIEFDDHRFTYGRTICLLQLEISGNIFLIDTLTVKNIEILIGWLENPAIRKVFHSCASDILLLREVMDCHVRNIDDTSLMYKFILESDQSISLSRLIKEYAGVKIKKEAQASDWTKRPLSNKQLNYAAFDVYYLRQVTQSMKEELKMKNRLTWYEEERQSLENIQPSISEPYDRIAKKARLSWKERVILQELWLAFDEMAEKLDMPNYKVISNARLGELAQSPPKSKQEWMNLKGVHPMVKSPAMAAKLHELVQSLYPNLEERAKTLQIEKGRRFGEYLSPQEQLDLVKRGEKYDHLKELLEKHLGIGMRTLLLPNSMKGQVLKEGLSSLAKWRIAEIERIEKLENLKFSSLW